MRNENLSSLCDVINGYAFKSSDYVDSGYRVIRITNVQKGFVVDDDPKFVSKIIADKANNFKLKLGDILISLTGNVGRIGRIQSGHLPAVLNQRVGLIRPISKELDDRFLFQYLNSDNFETEAIKNSNGVAQLNLSSKWIGNHQIPLPPLDDQIRIAHLLGKVEGLIAQRKQHLQQLDDLLKSVFLEMFGDPVRNEKGWEKRPLSTLCDFENGDRSSNYPSGDDIQDTGVLFLSSREIVNFRLALSNSIFILEEKFNSLSRGKCYRGDVLMVLRGAGLGKCCVFNGSHNRAFINAQMVILRCKSGMQNTFLVEQIKNERMFGELLKVGSGSAQPQLTAAQVKGFKVISPPIAHQEKFATIVEKIEGIKSRYQQSLAELEILYSALSQKAFKGELDLSRVPLAVAVPTENTENTDYINHEWREKQAGVAI